MILKKRNKKNIFLANIYGLIIFLNLLLIEPFFQISALGRVRYVLAISFVIISLIVFSLKKEFKIKKKSLFYFLSNIIPYCIIFLVMIIRSFFTDLNILNQITVFLYWIIPICLMQSAIYIFEAKAIDYTFWAIILNYSLCVVAYLNLYGFNGIINFFQYIEKGVSPLEVHELTFTLGLFFIYYAFFENKEEKYHKQKIYICVVCLFLGMKRIEIVALIIILLINSVLKKMNVKDKKKIMSITSVFFIVISISYIILVRNGFLNYVSQKYNINFNTRLEAYDYFRDDYTISPLYMGKGLGYVMDVLETLDRSVLYGIGDLHNDVLKLYIELGFVLWLFYFVNFSVLQCRRLKKRYNVKIEEIYFYFMVFTFILYLTDNVSRYLTYLLVFTMIPYAHYVKMISNQE